jgi:hypothetical protein
MRRVLRILSNPMTRYACFLLLWVLSLGLFCGPLRAAVRLWLNECRYSQISRIPLTSALLMYLNI